jgi:hypothetical protein
LNNGKIYKNIIASFHLGKLVEMQISRPCLKHIRKLKYNIFAKIKILGLPQ